jgi:hypothetical protein
MEHDIEQDRCEDHGEDGKTSGQSFSCCWIYNNEGDTQRVGKPRGERLERPKPEAEFRAIEEEEDYFYSC